MRQTNKRTPARGYNTRLYPNAYLWHDSKRELVWEKEKR